MGEDHRKKKKHRRQGQGQYSLLMGHTWGFHGDSCTPVSEIHAVPNFHPEIGKYKWVLGFSGRFPAEKA
ncbi:hypothetical protein llap_9990 [Limosa lapponica baueri]|uniref:Uncharacterized protein n=1 Tax=Limosa lapponica baueri TaxID=1758121 RepID=A0A2I0U185_LIMLA|nr:hypothetical protein llap_9990 [Limosa lapponica baueri]